MGVVRAADGVMRRGVCRGSRVRVDKRDRRARRAVPGEAVVQVLWRSVDVGVAAAISLSPLCLQPPRQFPGRLRRPVPGPGQAPRRQRDVQQACGVPESGVGVTHASSRTPSRSAAAAPPPTPVTVRTVVDPDIDLVSATVSCGSSSSSSISSGGGGGGAPNATACLFALRLAFPYPSTATSGADWGVGDAAHSTALLLNRSSSSTKGGGAAVFRRQVDGSRSLVVCRRGGEGEGGAEMHPLDPPVGPRMQLGRARGARRRRPARL